MELIGSIFAASRRSLSYKHGMRSSRRGCKRHEGVGICSCNDHVDAFDLPSTVLDCSCLEPACV